ncbi:MAG: hypothetical protein ACRECO_18030 [Xanthobacteraceae bacterium]
MNAPALPLAYAVRANVFEHEMTWRLGADALEVDAGAGVATRRFPYRDFTELRLSFAPTRFDFARYRCDLRIFGHPSTAILSTHYAGIGDFEDRAATYAPFMRGLVAQVAAANPPCRFRAGKHPATYIAEHVFLLAMIVLLVFVIGLVGGVGLSGLVMVKLGILLFYVPVMILYTRKNWPRRFDPHAIPDDVLPG